MAVNRTFHFRRIHIFAAGYDHVLHAVVDIHISVFIKISGISGLYPTTLGDSSLRRVGQVPIAKHVVR